MRVFRVSFLVSAVALAACGGPVDPAPRRVDATPLLAVLAAPAAPGARELRSGRLAEARGRLEATLAADPDRAAALNDLAVSYYLEARLDAARHLLEEVIARGGPREQQVALVNLAEVYAQDGYANAALAYLNSARAVDPARPEPAYALALLADARGDRAATAAAMKDALRADDGGAARRDLAFAFAEARVHLDALLAEAAGDSTVADARWRELRGGRFPLLAQAAQRHLEEP
ncbi:MAG: tetratricopeptide repeat protein [Anaeromyxobacteraceae bacterium]